jgi:hypothetical protein
MAGTVAPAARNFFLAIRTAWASRWPQTAERGGGGGAAHPPPPPPAGESRTSHIDGYRVTLDGDLAAGGEARLTLSVSRGGEAVTDLQPYLGAYGHLVALREGDLAYLHVHPDGAPGDGTTQPGPDVVFHAAVPSAGTYHLFLDFRHQGVVRTAAFTVSATGTNARASDGSGTSTDDGHSPH